MFFWFDFRTTDVINIVSKRWLRRRHTRLSVRSGDVYLARWAPMFALRYLFFRFVFLLLKPGVRGVRSLAEESEEGVRPSSGIRGHVTLSLRWNSRMVFAYIRNRIYEFYGLFACADLGTDGNDFDPRAFLGRRKITPLHSRWTFFLYTNDSQKIVNKQWKKVII